MLDFRFLEKRGPGFDFLTFDFLNSVGGFLTFDSVGRTF